MRGFCDNEIRALKAIFGAQIDYEKVRLMCGGGLNPIANLIFFSKYDAIVIGSKIYIRREIFCDDYSLSADNIGFLAHEAAHIWQYQNILKRRWLFKGISIAINSLCRKNPYDISDINADSDFFKLGYEQQAVIIQKYAAAKFKNKRSALSLHEKILYRAGLLPNKYEV